MARGNAPLQAFNRGIIDPRSLARTDLDRTRMSAEVMTNFLPKTQGAMILRPGTKHLGSSCNDTGAEWIEFVAATDQVNLLELTPGKMRVWDDDALLSRQAVSTTVTLSDTGWVDASTGGSPSTDTVVSDIIPAMSGPTTNGVTISASSENTSIPATSWRAANDAITDGWRDTGAGNSALPSWWNVNFGVGNTKTISGYSIRSSNIASQLDNAPSAWRLLSSNFDTGTYATDTGKWQLEDSRSSQTGWAQSEKRTYDLTDTGTADARRNWRLYFTATDGGPELVINEIEMFEASVSIGSQVSFNNGVVTLNAGSIGSKARVQKRVVVSDTGTEHPLYIVVQRGPVQFRVGSTEGDDDYIRETTLGTGYHNLTLTPTGQYFHITVSTDERIERKVSTLTIGDSGTLELATPWQIASLDNIRYDQSADVVYVTSSERTVKPRKIERRGTGNSWSVVEYNPDFGPFYQTRSSTARLKVSDTIGNTEMTADQPFFKPGHVGALIRGFHEGQSGVFYLGALDAYTDPIEITGINDTGAPGTPMERRIAIDVTGTYVGTLTVEASADGPDIGFHTIGAASPSDTGTFSATYNDPQDNLSVWYRVKMTSYTSGVAKVAITYTGGGTTGIARIVEYNNNQSVDVEVLRRFSDTGYTDNWQEGQWSEVQGYPSSVALHEGRLFWAGASNVWGSVSDDYENFDDEVDGESAPINRTFGSGPVDGIFYLVSLIRLVAGTSGSEVAIRSDSLDGLLTPENASAKAFSTQGSADIRALKLDSQAVFIQRSTQRVFVIGFGTGVNYDYESTELTLLVPKLLEAGIVSVAVQRQPDTRLHCVLADGRVGILTFEPKEEVLAWSMWQTDTGTDGAVEKAMVLPGVGEDQVYYHVRRNIDGNTRRFLEKWAREDEIQGDTGLSWLVDCAASYTDTGRSASLSEVAAHLAGGKVAVWSDDTGQALAGKDQSYDDTDGDQVLYDVMGNLIPPLTGYTDTGTGLTVSASRESVNFPVWRAFDRSSTEWWSSTGAADTGWVQVDFGEGNAKTVGSFMLRAGLNAGDVVKAPGNFQLQGTNDTGAGWTTEVAVTGDTGWSRAETKYYVDTGYTDTGANAYRYWRLLITANSGGGATNDIEIGEMALYPDDHFGGDVMLNEAVHHAVAGLPYEANYKSSKLAFFAQAGSALAQMKRVDKMGVILHQTHNKGLYFGGDSGNLDAMPEYSDEGAQVDADKIFEHFDDIAISFDGSWNTDSRVHLRAKSPRPCTVLALVPTVNTQERV